MAGRGGRQEGAWQLCDLIFICFLVLKRQDCWYFCPHPTSSRRCLCFLGSQAPLSWCKSKMVMAAVMAKLWGQGAERRKAPW